MKIYVASSWRNTYYPSVVSALRDAGHDVYDFRNPPNGDPGFHWTDVDPRAMEWTPSEYQEGLHHPKAERQFKNDIEAMESCDACVLVLPCGRSAHTEAGWFAGRGKKVIAYIPEQVEPELMYKLFIGVATTIDGLLKCIEKTSNVVVRENYQIELQIANILLQEVIVKPEKRSICIYQLVRKHLKKIHQKLRLKTPPEFEILEFAMEFLDYKVQEFLKIDFRMLNYKLILETLESIAKQEGSMCLKYADDGGSSDLPNEKRLFTLTPQARYDKRYATRIATNYAKSVGSKKPSFVCYWYGECVYQLENSHYLIIKDGLGQCASEEEAKTLQSALQETRFPWGKALFDMHETNVKNGNRNSYDMNIYCASTGGGYDCEVELDVIYDALEQAELLRKYVEFYPDVQFLTGGECEGQCDGWSYHPVLVDSL